MMRKMSEQLSELGLIDRKEHDKIEKASTCDTDPMPSYYLRKLNNFCPHDVGHFLG
jgi:hypothetical protein